MTFSELRELPEANKFFRTGMLAAVVWILALVLILRVTDVDTQATHEVFTGDRVLNAAVVYKSYPQSASSKSSSATDDPYAIATDIVDTLKLQDRVVNLSTQSSQSQGVLLQVERMYGEEMADLVTAFESQGLLVKTAEIRALPVDKERLLTATFSLEAAK